MVISAKGLKHVKHFSKMNVYAVVMISGGSDSEQKTPVDKDGGSNPTWDFPMQFTIDEVAAQMNRLVLIFQLRCDRTIRGDKDIGEVQVPIKELLDNAVDGKSTKVVTYPVKQPSGKPKGELKFSYKFGDKVSAPVTAYPATATSLPLPPAGGGYPLAGYPPAAQMLAGGAPPAQPPAGYPPVAQLPAGYPPVAGYPTSASVTEHGCPPYVGYAPTVVPAGQGMPSPAPHFGIPPVVQPEKKNEQELALEAALAEVIGAILLGDIVLETTDYANDNDAGNGIGAGY